jgi:hypothetical protein
LLWCPSESANNKMKFLIVTLCMIATICAYHIKKNEHNLKIGKVEYTRIPVKYNFGKLDKSSIIPTEELLKRFAHKMDASPQAGTQAVLNDYADKIFTNLQNLMIHNGFDPLEMPDLHTGFNYTLIITYYGDLDLTNGWLSDISTMHRGGDVLVEYSSNTRNLEITVPITFNDLMFTYDYAATIMGLGPKGGIDGKITDINIEAKLGFNTETFEATLEEFYITHTGTIHVEFNGNDLIDWLLNLLTDVATVILKEAILLVVEGIVRDGLNTAVDAINDAINGFLNPTTPIPSTTVATFMFK